MAEKKIVDLTEISTVDGSESFLVIDNGIQTYKIKPVNIPGLPRTPITELEVTLEDEMNAPIPITMVQAIGYAYADKNDKWKLNFNIEFYLNSAGVHLALLVNILGVVFKNEPNQYVGADYYDDTPEKPKAFTGAGFGHIYIQQTNEVIYGFRLFGDVELEEMPDWADPAEFRRAEGFSFRDAGTVTSVNGMEGDVVLTTSDIPEGSRPYFTDARAKLAVVDNAITPGVTDKAPSEAAVSTALTGKQSTSQKNQPNGYAGTDGSGKIPLGLLPSTILGALVYKGSWNASTGAYPSGASQGWYYIVNVPGTISGVTYAIKDWMVFNGSSWDKVSGAASAVDSVNGQVGIVTLDSDDIGEGVTNLYFTDDRARGAAVENAIVDGVTNKAPSQNSVYDALALRDTAISEKQDADEKGQPNGFAPLDENGFVPQENLPEISGGLVANTITGDATASSNIKYEIDLTSIAAGSALTLTLPSGTDAAVVSFTDKKGLCSPGGTGKYIDIKPDSGQSINGYAADDIERYDWANATGTYYRVAGETTWYCDYQMTSSVPDATGSTPGQTKKNKLQTKSSTAQWSADTTSILSFSNLVIGNLYKITIRCGRCIRSSATGNALITVMHNGVNLMNPEGGANQGGVGLGNAGAITEPTDTLAGLEASVPFTAAATSVRIDAVVTNGSILGVFACLEELNNYEVTTDWT